METNNQYSDLPEPFRQMVLNRDRIIEDDQNFVSYLVDLVHLGQLKPSHALYLYCARFKVDRLVLVDLTLAKCSPRPPEAEFFDAILAGEDMSGFLAVLGREREAGRL